LRTVNIFGVTGSIGQSTLDVINFQSSVENFQINALTSHSNVELLAQNCITYGARYAVIANPNKYRELKDALSGTKVVPLAGIESLIQVAEIKVDWTINAIVGFAGLKPSLASAKSGTVLALANKESLVCAGDLLTRSVKDNGSTLLPVDSEHSAIFQCLQNETYESVDKVILTASGGPFRKWSVNEMKTATLQQAITHPNWSMGARISIDSATMFNKALEVIEAKYLFDLPIDDIEVLVHPESIVHSMVQYKDGSIIAQLGSPDMRGAIGYSLNHPRRLPLPVDNLDLATIGSLNFAKVDSVKFPALKLAYDSVSRGPLFGAVLNAAKEIALDKFISGEIKFLQMTALVQAVLDSNEIVELEGNDAKDLDSVTYADLLARRICEGINLS
jgi:1-deoxy-D-xylulose-5-phosphate reductoisomerase